MDIPIGVDVTCADGVCGRSTRVIVDPVSNRVTHLVVAEKYFPNSEFLVPLEHILESSPSGIRLRGSLFDLRSDPFLETEFVDVDPEEMEEAYATEMGMDEGVMMWPYVLPDPLTVPLERERIPPGELEIRRGARVEASDGHVGRVDEFVVNPRDGHITHILLRKGHLWGQREIAIPVASIDSFLEDAVHLKLNRKSVESLPDVPVRRKWK